MGRQSGNSDRHKKKMAIRAVAGRGEKAAGLKKHNVFIKCLWVREQKGSFHGVFLTLTFRSTVFCKQKKRKSFFGRPLGRPSHPQASNEGQKPGPKGIHLESFKNVKFHRISSVSAGRGKISAKMYTRSKGSLGPVCAGFRPSLGRRKIPAQPRLSQQEGRGRRAAQ